MLEKVLRNLFEVPGELVELQKEAEAAAKAAEDRAETVDNSETDPDALPSSTPI